MKSEHDRQSEPQVAKKTTEKVQPDQLSVRMRRGLSELAWIQGFAGGWALVLVSSQKNSDEAFYAGIMLQFLGFGLSKILKPRDNT